MTLIRTGLLNAIAVVVRIVTLMGLNKVLAIYIGPSGYAIIGQFQNFVGMLTTLASGAFNLGVTKYTAEHYDDEARQIGIWKTAGTIALTGSIAIAIIISALHRHLAVWILRNENLGSVFVLLGTGLVLFTLNSLLLAILNGKKEIYRLVTINILGSIAGLLVTGGLAVWFGLYGALLALAISHSIVFGITLGLCWRTTWFRVRNLVGRIDPVALRSLGKYTLMALVTAVCIPGGQIIIRNHLGVTFGWPAAGHWEALMRISGLYLMVVTTPLAIYYLPRLSEIRDNGELRSEMIRGYRLILPVAVVSALSIYLLRDWLVLTLFTKAFAPMRELFAWQMLGDIMKIGSWLLAYVMLGRAMVRTFIVTEIAFAASWLGFVWLFTRWYGVQGAQIGYCLNYTLYWVVMAVVILRRVRGGSEQWPPQYSAFRE